MMDSLFFSLANAVVNTKDLAFLRSTGWLSSLLGLIAKHLQPIAVLGPDAKKNLIRSNFAKGLMMFICRCHMKFSFAEFTKDVGIDYHKSFNHGFD